jgi:hypothetical protein
MSSNYPLPLIFGGAAGLALRVINLLLQFVYCVLAVLLVRLPRGVNGESEIQYRPAVGKKTKAAIASAAVLILAAVVVSIVVEFRAHSEFANMNIRQTDDSISVTIGYTGVPGDNNAEEYVRIREGVMAELEKSDPISKMQALLIFNEYMEIDQVNEILGTVYYESRIRSNIRIDEVYVGIPGELGETVIPMYFNDSSEYNDIDASFRRFIEDSLSGDNLSSQQRTDTLSLRQSGRIFAVKVRADTWRLEQLALKDNIFVDPLYSREAEALSEKSGKPVSYICVPARPGGARRAAQRLDGRYQRREYAAASPRSRERPKQ